MKHVIEICICTFRRPHLAKTLASVARLSVPSGCELRVLVVDNDDWPSARSLATEVHLPFELAYVHAPARNISVARNAGLENSKGDFLVFLDDDETVSKDWIDALYEKMVSTDADVIFGRIVARYPTGTADWLVAGDYHSTQGPEDTTKAIKTGCSANVMIRRDRAHLHKSRFDLELGRTGGEDTVYFRDLYQAGAQMRFADNAVVYEAVDPKRLSLRWLLMRKFRSGQSYARSEIGTSEQPMMLRAKLFAQAGAKAAACAGMWGLYLLERHKRNFWAIRGALHVGVLSKCVGLREPILYGHCDEPLRRAKNA